MSFKADMTSTDVDRQIALLKYYPEVVEKHFRAVMIGDIGRLYADISPKIPTDKGKARATFKKRITGKGIDMQGQVGWWGKGTAWYINVVEYGAKPHNINSFAPGAGVYYKQHPGQAAQEFMADSFAAFKPIIEADMIAASERVVNEMAVP